MPSDIEKKHANQYKKERKSRWNMAERGEESAIKGICKKFAEKLLIDINDISFERYDELWFSEYDIDLPENEWIKGASDYLVKVRLDSEKYLFVEIKLKSQEYRKTINGGMTENKSLISKYGCSSFYLDIKPVLENMNNFIKNTNKKYNSFIVAFVKEDFSEINIISLARIDKLILNGWLKNNKNIKICKYGEGYGQIVYLIPKDVTVNIEKVSKEDLIKIMMNDYPSPKDKSLK